MRPGLDVKCVDILFIGCVGAQILIKLIKSHLRDWKYANHNTLGQSVLQGFALTIESHLANNPNFILQIR